MIQPKGRESMIQRMKECRSGWGVLAVGALVASVLAAGAVPAAAVTDRADRTTRLSVCVAAAAEDRMFTDVSEDHVFKDAINCIAYYGITHGTDDGSTYSPDWDVTRAQMAVFVARAAAAAGVGLGSGSGGFNDIGGIWAEARDAINGLAVRGIIRSGGNFRPDDAITRAEMATFLIGLLAKASPNVTIDPDGAILLGAPGSRTEADDYFADVRSFVPAANDAEISALYELGITKGASPAAVHDDTAPPLDLNYEPEGTVDRGQMAAFITRALAHTSVRPAGVTAQYDGAEVVVSVRDGRYQPVPLAAVDVFWATADRAGRALLANGACRLSAVTQADLSSYPCEIDDTDPVTGRDGDARVAVAGLRRVPAGGAVVWAWTGQNEDTLNAGVDPYRLDVAEGADGRFATTAVVTTTFDAQKVRFGGAVTYSIQLKDPTGNVHRGVDGVEPARWTLSVLVTGHSDAPEPPEETIVSDSSGEAVFSIPFAGSFDDPNPATSNELIATFTLIPADNAPPSFATVDAGGRRATTGTVVFSDEDSSIATVTIDTPDYIHVSGRGGAISNSVTVTARDQYGSPFPGAMVKLQSSGAGVAYDNTGTVDSRGSLQFSYSYSGTGHVPQTLTVGYGDGNTTDDSETKTVYWTVDPGPSGNDRTVLAGNVHRRQIVVDDGGPVLLAYDENDRFDVSGVATTLAVFEAELAEALARDNPGRQLTWSNYQAGTNRPITEYNLS